MPAKKAKLILLSLCLLLLMFGCAKRNTEWQGDGVLTKVASIPLVGSPLDMSFGDNTLFVAEDQGGLSQINLSDYSVTPHTTLTAIDGSTVVLTKIRRVSYVPERNRLFINETDGTDMIHIVNADTLSSLKVIGAITGATQDISDLRFSNIANPVGNLTIEGVFSNGRTVNYGLYDGVADIWFGITQPFSTPASAAGFALTDTHLFVAAEQRGLIAYSRATGSMVGIIDTPGEAQKVCVQGNYAYVACRQSGVQVVDVTDPSDMEITDGFDTSGYAVTVEANGNHLVVASGLGGVYLFDITNPSQLNLLENLTSCGYANNARFADGKLFVAARDQGILVYTIE